MGEFKNNLKHGIGSSIEGVNLEQVLKRILIPVQNEFNYRNQGKKSKQTKTSNNSYGQSFEFELESNKQGSDYNSQQIIYGGKDVMLGRVFNGQYAEGLKNGYGVVRDWKTSLCKKGVYREGKLDGFGVIRWKRQFNEGSEARRLKKLRNGSNKLMARQHHLKSSQTKFKLATLLNYSELDCIMFEENEYDYLYIGYFKNGEMHGYGIEVSRSENTNRLTEYRGFFNQGERHGVGLSLEYSSSYSKPNIPNLDLSGSALFEKYCPVEQSTKFDLREKGIVSLALCGFKNGKRDGLGVEYFENGDVYSGEWKNGLKHGFGSYRKLALVEDNSGPAGKYSFSQKGKSVYSHIVYIGEFVKDQRHGKGRLEQKNRFIYDGDWVCNTRNGLGYQVSFDPTNPKNKQSEYIGGWKRDTPHGIGYKISQKSSYKGQYYEGKPHGYGTLKVYKEDNYSEYSGLFEEGNFMKPILPQQTENYKKLVGTLQKVPKMPRRLGQLPVPRIDAVLDNLRCSQEKLEHLKSKFLLLDQKCEELGISFDNVFQILFKLFVNLSQKLKPTHYRSLDYFLSAVPGVDPRVDKNKLQSIQIEDYANKNTPKDNVFDKHIKAFGNKPKEYETPFQDEHFRHVDYLNTISGNSNHPAAGKQALKLKNPFGGSFNPNMEEDIRNFGDTDRQMQRDVSQDEPGVPLKGKDKLRQELKELLILKAKVDARKKQLMMQGRTLNAVVDRPEQLDLELQMKLAQQGGNTKGPYADLVTTDRKADNALNRQNDAEIRGIKQKIALLKSQLERIKMERERLLSELPDNMKDPSKPKYPILAKRNPNINEMDDKQLDEKLTVLKAKKRKLNALRKKQELELSKNDEKLNDIQRQIDEQLQYLENLKDQEEILAENQKNFEDKKENYERGAEIRQVLDKRLNQKNKEINDVQTDLTKKQGEKREKDNKLNQLKQEVGFLQSQIDELNSKEGVAYKTDPVTGERVRDLTFGLIVNMGDINKAKTDIEELKQEIKDLERQLEEKRANQGLQQTQISDMNDKIHEITKETENIRQDYLKEQKAVAALENEVSSIQNDTETQKKLLKEAEEDIAKLDKDIIQVAAQLLNIVLPEDDNQETVKAKIAEVVAKKEVVDKKIEELEKQRKELREKEDQYTVDFNAHEKKKEEVEAQENETEKLQQKNSNLRDELREKRKKLEQQKDYMDREETRIAREEVDLKMRKEEIEDEIKKVKKNLGDQEAITKLLYEKQAELELAKSKLARDKTEHDNIESQNNNLEKELDEAHEANKRQEKLISQLIEQNNGDFGKKEQEKATEELRKLNKKKELLKDQKIEHAKMLNILKLKEAQQAKEDKEKLSKQSDLLKKKIEISKRQFQENLDTLTNKKIDLNKEMEKLTNSVKWLKEEDLKLEGGLKNVENEIAILTKDMEDFQKSRDAELKACNTEFDQIEKNSLKKKEIFKKLTAQKESGKGDGAVNENLCLELRNEALDVVRNDANYQTQQSAQSNVRWQLEKQALKGEIEELKRLIASYKSKGERAHLGGKDKTLKKIGLGKDEVERRSQKVKTFDELMPALDLSKMTNYAEESKNMEVSISNKKNGNLTNQDSTHGGQQQQRLKDPEDDIILGGLSDYSGGGESSDEEDSDFEPSNTTKNLNNNNEVSESPQNQSDSPSKNDNDNKALPLDSDVKLFDSMPNVNGGSERSRINTGTSIMLNISNHDDQKKKKMERGMTIPQIVFNMDGPQPTDSEHMSGISIEEKNALSSKDIVVEESLQDDVDHLDAQIEERQKANNRERVNKPVALSQIPLVKQISDARGEKIKENELKPYDEQKTPSQISIDISRIPSPQQKDLDSQYSSRR